ncbi:DUF190 domain-containing protein [Chromobacterium sp. IIBBL 290-4]|uniref:DUF190 domain-containing protein n=1 Tax=Chromobacterium sp. IIBBL 290-4 TaxID=2953890 RepID=UPI0020B7D959|nr:DUF190 domain-containing protein [Chromobacterium sp. IIBBL 290-4]UTH74823.1 DUF190 domain-containing protein [Chromobacterium sp. IIBBL 290-4]
MQGYQLSFFTQQDHRHHGLPLGEWIMQEARRLGIRGATLFAASEGFGNDRRIHAARFFDLADQPVEVTLALSAQEADLLLQRLREEGVKVFYMKTPVEYGMLGEG